MNLKRLTEDMSKRPLSGAAASSRDERLRAALRENLARRKAQGRARAAESEQQKAEQGEGADSNGPPNQES